MQEGERPIISFTVVSPGTEGVSRTRIDRSGDGDLRRVHLLTPEHQLAQLKANLAVVDHEGGLAYTQKHPLSAAMPHTLFLSSRHFHPAHLPSPPSPQPDSPYRKRGENLEKPTLNKSNQPPRAAAHTAQGTRHVLGRPGDRRPRGRGDARQALGGLGLVLGGGVLGALGGLLGLLRGGALEAAGGDVAEHIGAPHQRACEGGGHGVGGGGGGGGRQTCLINPSRLSVPGIEASMLWTGVKKRGRSMGRGGGGAAGRVGNWVRSNGRLSF